MAAGDATRTLLARFATDTSALDRSTRQLEGSGRQMGDRLSKGFEGGISRMGRVLRTVLAFSAIRAAIRAVGSVFSTISGEAREAQKATAQTEAVIKSMGASSWTSSQQIAALSDALSRKRGVDDELIQSGANVLLTFGKIRNEVGQGNDIFNRATALAHDMSVALGTDMNAAAIQVGKALNDPIKGMTALGRAGVSFTQQQKDQVKAMVEAGDVLGAQKLILSELDNQFAGSAEAQATAGDKIRVAWQNVLELFGSKVMPIVDRFFGFMSDRGIPAVTALAAVVGTYLQPHLERFGQWVQGTAIPALQAFGMWLIDNIVPAALQLGQAFVTHILPHLTAFGGYLFGTVIPALGQAAEWLGRNQGLLLTVGAAIAALTIVTKLHTAAMAVQTAGGMIAWLTQMAMRIGVVRAAVAAWTAVQWVLNAALHANPIGLVILALTGLAAVLVIAWQRSETFRRIVGEAWDWIREKAGGAWSWLQSNVFTPFGNVVKTAGDQAVAMKDAIADAFNAIPGAVRGAWSGLINGIMGAVRGTISWINTNLIGKINAVTKHFNLTIPLIPMPGGSGGRGGGGGRAPSFMHEGGVAGQGGRGAPHPADRLPAMLEPGEGIIRTRRLRALARRFGLSPSGFMDMLNTGRTHERQATIGATGSAGLASGGAAGGPFDWVKGIGQGIVAGISQIGDWLQQGAAFALDKILSPVVGGISGVVSRAGGTGWLGGVFRGGMQMLKDAAVRWGSGQDQAATATLRGTGSLAGGKPAASGWSKPIGPGYRIGRGSRGHGYLAQDLPAPTGTPVYAMHGGTVTRAADLTTSYGRHLFIAHPGTTGVYAHLSRRLVGARAVVRSGQLIGLVGSTGNSTGPHLHLETRGYDPLSFLRSRGIRFDHGGRLAPGQNLVNNQTGGYEDLVNTADLPFVFRVTVKIGDRDITDIVSTEVQAERKKDDDDLYAQGVHI